MALETTELVTQDAEPGRTTLVDARNGFNKLIRLEMLWTVRHRHRWELPGNYPVFTVVMAIYHYVERIW